MYSTGPRLVRETPRPGRKGYWEREKIFDFSQPDDHNRFTGSLTGWSVGNSLDRLSLFGLEKPIF